MKKLLSVLLAGAIILSLSACGGKENKHTESSDPPDLSGQWRQVNNESEDSYQGAIIEDDVIEIYWVSNGGDTRSLYWSGTFEEPDTVEEPYSWESEKNEARTEHSLMSSGDDTKTFTYENGQITYSSSIMGTTTKVRLEKEEWEPGLEVVKIEPLDLSGQWKQINSDIEGYYYGAVINGDRIEIYNASDIDDIRTLYWSGSFTSPDTSDELYSWVSKNNFARTELSSLASSDNTKSFTYENGQISYSVTSLGVTSTVYLEKEEWAPDLINEEFYEISYSTISVAGIEFSIPTYLQKENTSTDTNISFTAYLRGDSSAGAALNFIVIEDIDVSQGDETIGLMADSIRDAIINNDEGIEILSHSKNDILLAGLSAKSLTFTTVNSHGTHGTMYIVCTYNPTQRKALGITLIIPKEEIHSSRYFNRFLERVELLESEHPTESSTTTNGIRPEFKEAMDSYEEFFDKYASFMEKYAESSGSPSMFSDYMKFLDQYTETMEAMEKLGKEEMSIEESAYYLEVTTRINQKLLNSLS